MLPGQKTFIMSMLYGVAALVEMFNFMDFPFITDPATSLQVAITAVLIRIGIGKPKVE